MMAKPDTIAIDGPAASGKSTLAEKLAETLGYLYFDTGVMYRAVTWAALCTQIPIESETRIVNLAESLDIDIRPPSVDDGRNYDVIVDGADVTWAIRSPQVETQVSKVSAYEGVRRALTAQQRSIGNRGRVVMVGRDIGTVVMPNAELKIFLDASFEERAKRRYRETLERGLHASYEEILASMRKRDQIDSTRKIAPLVPDREAVIIQSDEMNAQQILDYVLGLIDDDDPL